MPLYCYAVVPAASVLPPGVTGLLATELELVAHGELAVVVSSLSGRIRPQRSNLAAHQKVLAELSKVSDVLPMSFGTLADDHAAVIRLIEEGQEPLLEALDRVGGKVEMTLRLTLAVENPFAHLVTVDEDLRDARDRMVSNPTHEAKVNVGRMFESKLGQLRDLAAETVSSHLDAVVAEQKYNPVRNEKQILALALLVFRDKQDEFNSAIAKAAEAFDDHYTFEISGPWPPQSFVDVKLDIPELAEVPEFAEVSERSEVADASGPNILSSEAA